MTAADTLNLSIPKRIQFVEDIWDTIASQAEAAEFTENEKRMLDERLEAYHHKPQEGSPLREFYQRIVNQHDP